MSSGRINAAAQALCAAYAKDTETDFDLAWEAHKSIWLQDATVAIEAADFSLGDRSARSLRTEISRHKANITELDTKNKELEIALTEYRKRFGVLGMQHHDSTIKV